MWEKVVISERNMNRASFGVRKRFFVFSGETEISINQRKD